MKILLLREDDAAAKTIKALRDFEVVHTPLFKMIRIDAKCQFSHYNHVILTSKNALFAVNRISFDNIYSVGKAASPYHGTCLLTSDQLIPLVKKLTGSILYLRGRHISKNLKQYNHNIEELVCYEMLPIAATIDATSFDLALLYSKRQAEAFKVALRGDCKHKIAICISEQVANLVKDKMQVLIAKHPHEESMLEVLWKIKQS